MHYFGLTKNDYLSLRPDGQDGEYLSLRCKNLISEYEHKILTEFDA